MLATGKRPYVLVDLYGEMNALPKLIDDRQRAHQGHPRLPRTGLSAGVAAERRRGEGAGRPAPPGDRGFQEGAGSGRSRRRPEAQPGRAPRHARSRAGGDAGAARLRDANDSASRQRGERQALEAAYDAETKRLRPAARRAPDHRSRRHPGAGVRVQRPPPPVRQASGQAPAGPPYRGTARRSTNRRRGRGWSCSGGTRRKASIWIAGSAPSRRWKRANSQSLETALVKEQRVTDAGARRRQPHAGADAGAETARPPRCRLEGQEPPRRRASRWRRRPKLRRKRRKRPSSLREDFTRAAGGRRRGRDRAARRVVRRMASKPTDPTKPDGPKRKRRRRPRPGSTGTIALTGFSKRRDQR